ncbi:MAG TPA: hypothetical protein VGC41_23250 [Kofleriaceae bacterium]
MPSAKAPVPLVVVLHGDREHANAAAARWRATTKKRGYALLSIDCPKELGCTDSWWQWDGDPQYVLDRIASIEKQVPISKTILVGWSGGASYLGMHAQAWSSVDAIVIHGGGVAPLSDQCTAGPPVYFLVGTKNPLHHLAIALRDYFTNCKRELVWDVVADADHGKEAAALSPKKAEAILDWVLAH